MRPFAATLVLFAFFHGGVTEVCKENDPNLNQCIKDGINHLLPELKNGLKGAPGIDPVELPLVSPSYSKGEITLDLVIKNLAIRGLSQATVQAVKSKNLYMGKLEVVMKVPLLEAVGVYSTEGTVAGVPLSSQGTFNITLVDSTMVWIVYLERYEVEGERRLAVGRLALDLTPEQMYLTPAPQLDGRNDLGKTLSVYLNENSFELYNMVKSPLLEWAADLAREMINAFFSVVPDTDIFSS